MVDPLRKMMIDYLMADKFPTKGPIGKALKNHLVSGVCVDGRRLPSHQLGRVVRSGNRHCDRSLSASR
jgi:hypothetical protein